LKKENKSKQQKRYIVEMKYFYDILCFFLRELKSSIQCLNLFLAQAVVIKHIRILFLNANADNCVLCLTSKVSPNLEGKKTFKVIENDVWTGIRF